MSNPPISDFSIKATDSIRDAIACIDRSKRTSVALVLDDHGRMVNIITDGDVRRGILAGINLSKPVSKLFPIKSRMPRPLPFTLPADTDPNQFLKIMKENAIKQIPLLDKNGKVVDIVILSDLLTPPKLPLQAVVMAGGLGTRLRPLTDNVPKPMLLVGGRPLMELTIEKLHNAGIERVYVSTNYRASNIIDHFGDGKAFGIKLNYIQEDMPLGTAGALGLMDVPDKTLLVINGDIITHVDLGAMLDYHKEHQAELTVGVRQYGVQVPYGVVECDGPTVCKLEEKPQISFLVNAGIYLLEPSVYSYILKGKRMDMTDLIKRLLDGKRPVVSFPIIEYWLDIGQPADYERAQNDLREGKYNHTHDSDS